MFDLKDDGNENIFREPTSEEKRVQRHKEHNRRQKNITKIIGENLASYALVLIVALMVVFIWADIGLFKDWKTFFGDAAVTIVLYILADICSTYIGAQGGKLDDGYIKIHQYYLDLRERVRTSGITLMPMFCDWQIDEEYQYYIRRRCKEAKIDYAEYMEKYHGKSLEELREIFPYEDFQNVFSQEEKNKRGFVDRVKIVHKKAKSAYRGTKTSSKAAKIFSINQVKPIELTPDILMTDGKVKNLRGDVPMGGEEYIEKHTKSKQHIALTVVICVISAVPVFTLAREFSVGALIYTIFKITLLLYRMYSGYTRGAKGYNTVEPKHIEAKIKYLYMYLEFLDKKTYETLDKYNYINRGNNVHDTNTDKSESLDQERRGENSRGGEFHNGSAEGI